MDDQEGHESAGTPCSAHDTYQEQHHDNYHGTAEAREHNRKQPLCWKAAVQAICAEHQKPRQDRVEHGQAQKGAAKKVGNEGCKDQVEHCTSIVIILGSSRGMRLEPTGHSEPYNLQILPKKKKLTIGSLGVRMSDM